jgi:hypothetical protein
MKDAKLYLMDFLLQVTMVIKKTLTGQWMGCMVIMISNLNFKKYNVAQQFNITTPHREYQAIN